VSVRRFQQAPVANGFILPKHGPTGCELGAGEGFTTAGVMQIRVSGTVSIQDNLVGTSHYEVDVDAEAARMEVWRGAVLRQHTRGCRVRGFDCLNYLVDILDNDVGAGARLEALLGRDPEESFGAVLVLVLGHIRVFGGELLGQLLESVGDVGDVFEEDEPENNVVVPALCLSCSSKPKLTRPFFLAFGAIVAMMRHHSVEPGNARRRVVDRVRLSVSSIAACF
jgi:hypothetical protein